MKRMSYYIIGLLLSLMSWSCSDDAETGREEIPVETDGGYLFAHMTNANYESYIMLFPGMASTGKH